MTQTARQTTRVLLATIAGALALLAGGVGNAAAAPAASQEATANCWLQVINDWLAHQPNLTGTYAIPCYTQAIQHLNLYPDVQGYSSATDDIRNAMLAVIHEEGGGRGGPPAPSGPSSGPNSSGPGSSGPKKGGGGPISWLGDHLAPGNAQSVPLPLIVLGGLALLLLLAAAGTWFARRLQSRRMTPAPAPSPAPRR